MVVVSRIFNIFIETLSKTAGNTMRQLIFRMMSGARQAATAARYAATAARNAATAARLAPHACYHGEREGALSHKGKS